MAISPELMLAILAMDFYKSVIGQNQVTSVQFTGHSLGGGLAGFIASIYICGDSAFNYHFTDAQALQRAPHLTSPRKRGEEPARRVRWSQRIFLLPLAGATMFT
jgi:hypothetical protein